MRTSALLATLLLGLLPSSCQRRGPAPAPARAQAPAPAQAQGHGQGTAAAPSTPTAASMVVERVDDERYVKVVRRLLTKHGCDASNCHGAIKGGGLYFSSGNPHYQKDYQAVIERINRKAPRESELIKKALGKVPHIGGKNLADDECDTRRLLAWIGDEPDIECKEPPPPQTAERFAREVAPALVALGCAAASCHGTTGGAGNGRLDLSGLAAGAARKDDALASAYKAFMGSRLNHLVVWMSPVLKAAWGEDAAHKRQVDLRSCAYRRLHGFIAGSPEATCTVDQPLPDVPSFAAFSDVVLPEVAKRGCVESDCHGRGAGDMPLFEFNVDGHARLHNYLALTSRVEDPSRPDESTLLRTARNKDPHGGGARLGGAGDCIDELVVRWLRGQKVRRCPPPTPPSYERFASEVQPVLDKMTCTQAACHGEEVTTFHLTPRARGQAARANYQAVLKHIDFDFMPFSQVMLRMREPCAYSVVGAWIEKKPRPDCVVHDPDPSVFPRRDRKGNVVHPKVEPGPPPQKI